MVNPKRASRRRFLTWSALGVGGTALALAGGVFVMVRPGAKSASRKALSDDEVRFLDAAAEAYFPPGNGLRLDVASLRVGEAADELIAGFPALQRQLVRGLFHVFDAWPRLSVSSTRAFTDLPLADRIEILQVWDKSNLVQRRGLGEALRAILGLAVFSRPEALAAVGYVDGCARTM